ncbi:PIR Superfamily Protein [Plasmodium ovale wallikeri]|uniref:PIR Superfamily Protein n=1 Tax=Plasmodium ovale wallikeri TaxID=864142 RepID=A0A1A9AFZ3_PLAOA|nr:PIR Superfamily Protein [Plasmodium ovale wallikeri]SBT56281.1 PIR Superfamily Protein [Plasmodium ovale wallikeri]
MDVHPLTSVSDYDKLDKKFITSGDVEKCNELDRALNSQYEDDMGVYFFCSKLTGNLKNYHNLVFSEFFNKFRCKYLNMWIYECLLKEIPDSHDRRYTFIKKKIIEFWKHFKVPENECTWDFISYINENDYKKMKNLYDYALNYNILQFYFKKRNDPCTAKDNAYIQQSVQLFDKVKDECKSDSIEPYCIALREIIKIYKDDELSKLSCNRILSDEEVYNEVDEKLSKQQEGVVFHEYSSQGSYAQPPDSLAATEQGTDSVSDSPNAITIFVPFLGLLPTFLLLYKFTPLGSKIRSNFQGKKLIGFNIIKEEEQEILENIYDSEETTTHNDLHRISYHQLMNT